MVVYYLKKLRFLLSKSSSAVLYQGFFKDARMTIVRVYSVEKNSIFENSLSSMGKMCAEVSERK